MTIRKLYFGDNIVVMKKHIESATVDLVYLDPPFNSAADYNLLFKEDGLSPDEAQMHAFKDTWIWDTSAAEAYHDIQDLDNDRLIELINALNRVRADTHDGLPCPHGGAPRHDPQKAECKFAMNIDPLRGVYRVQNRPL